MVLEAIQVFQKIEDGDVKLLSQLEKATRRYKWIPEDRLRKIGDMPQQDIEYRLGRLNRYNLIESGTEKYKGYRIVPTGYDILALWYLVENDTIRAFGRSLGIGKEADIYDALTPEGERVALKFNRLGLSFTSLKKTRSYAPKHGWIEASKKAAKKEFEVLKKLYSELEVPKPIAYNRHILVMGLIEGDELTSVTEIDLPELVLDEILRNVKKAYGLNIIHGDLSEHNVIIKENGEVMIIDWPQWKERDHPEADELIRRDLQNILKFFRRKFGIQRDLETTLEEIRS